MSRASCAMDAHAAATMRTIADILGAGPLVGVGVWDALSAKLAADAGLSTLFVSGYCVSATRLGEPDLGLVTQTEMLDVAARVVAAVDVPVVVDIDTGYGNEFNVERTVRELVRIGAAGCFLEDQVWPKRCGHMEGKQVVDLDDYLPKLAAALAARGDASFHVTARTDARAVYGLDEAIRRARAFAEAGADAVFVEAPESVGEMDAVRAAVPAHVPLVANMVEHGKTPLRTTRALAAAGYEIVVMPVTGILAAARAMRDAFAALASNGDSAAVRDRLLGFEELNGFLGLGERYRRESRS
jgi:2-methylisocitrate lyase-like PEP mutase family enzyme